MPGMIFRRTPPALSLALQGGGAHGAFTWGVIDALLERGLGMAAVSGASAGAINAVVLAHGLTQGGDDGARAALHAFWQAIAERVPPLLHLPDDPPQLAPVGHAMLAWTRWFAPSQLNPLNLNPLRDVLAAQIDFERLRSTRGMALFIAATEVARGRLRLVRRNDVTIDAVLASACLPQVAHPVLIDGQPTPIARSPSCRARRGWCPTGRLCSACAMPGANAWRGGSKTVARRWARDRASIRSPCSASPPQSRSENSVIGLVSV
jgi:predicted acylesterase/phospholipase RssA